ncbi:MAG: glycosyltransferase, partial [Trebonia sp.]
MPLEPRPGSVAWPPGATMITGDRELAPPGVRLASDSGTRLVAGGSVLVGGSPVRVLRLTPAGARQVASWFAGAPVPSAASARKLARRLLDAGIAHPDLAARGGADGGLGAVEAGSASGPAGAQQAAGAQPAAGVARWPSPDGVTVVIPVRDRHAELARCLSGLRDLPHVIVVDDASADPVAIKRIAEEHGAVVIRRPVNGGPGAARNTGLGAAGTDIVAFLDSDCVPRPGWLEGLLPHFSDPAVGAVAPR